MRPSACQRLFEEDQRGRAPIRKCTVASCPLSTASRFRKAFTQPHWAHRRRSPSLVRPSATGTLRIDGLTSNDIIYSVS